VSHRHRWCSRVLVLSKEARAPVRGHMIIVKQDCEVELWMSGGHIPGHRLSIVEPGREAHKEPHLPRSLTEVPLSFGRRPPRSSAPTSPAPQP